VSRAPYPDHCEREYGETSKDDNIPWNLATMALKASTFVPGGGRGNFKLELAAGLYP
jgi:hypothetical protein